MGLRLRKEERKHAIHQDNNGKVRFLLHSTSHLELAAKDSSGQ